MKYGKKEKKGNTRKVANKSTMNDYSYEMKDWSKKAKKDK